MGPPSPPAPPEITPEPHRWRSPTRRFQEHEDEEIIAAVVELFQIDRELNRQYASVNGRPLFTVPLSDEEKWLRWEDPATRAQIIKQIVEREGPQAVPKYVAHMAAIDRKLHENGQGPSSGPVRRAAPPRPGY